ncbi:unnamed protein product [Urochloa humidicola]
MPPPPVLADELVEEVLLRIPPDDPASLVRAAFVCKPWCRVASDPGFRGRFRERHHQAVPPVLGVLCKTATSRAAPAPPASSPLPPSTRTSPAAAGAGACSTPATAASSSPTWIGSSAPLATPSSSGTQSPATAWSCPSCRATPRLFVDQLERRGALRRRCWRRRLRPY